MVQFSEFDYRFRPKKGQDVLLISSLTINRLHIVLSAQQTVHVACWCFVALKYRPDWFTRSAVCPIDQRREDWDAHHSRHWHQSIEEEAGKESPKKDCCVFTPLAGENNGTLTDTRQMSWTSPGPFCESIPFCWSMGWSLRFRNSAGAQGSEHTRRLMLTPSVGCVMAQGINVWSIPVLQCKQLYWWKFPWCTWCKKTRHRWDGDGHV